MRGVIYATLGTSEGVLKFKPGQVVVFAVDIDGRITATVRKGDTAATWTFKNADDMKQREPPALRGDRQDIHQGSHATPFPGHNTAT